MMPDKATRLLFERLQADMASTQKALHERLVLLSGFYITGTQQRRMIMYYQLGSYRAVATAEGVNVKTVWESINGVHREEPAHRVKRHGTSWKHQSIKSKLQIAYCDLEIQRLLHRIKTLRDQLNEIEI